MGAAPLLLARATSAASFLSSGSAATLVKIYESGSAAIFSEAPGVLGATALPLLLKTEMAVSYTHLTLPTKRIV